ncbi:MAG: hypothetical protein HY074_20120 [Deltaproteobacteria bacterium]|nr:hypothetical protein [Deltaproteobacteria bacterium]
MSKSLLALVAMAMLVSGVSFAGDSPRGRHFEHIVTVILENATYKKAMADPYLAQLSRRGAFLKNYSGVFHPSYPNYLALVAGNFFWTWFDTQKTIDEPNIADLLEAQGYTWKNYAEDYPGGCFLGSMSGKYARRHVPFLSFKSIQRNPERCARVVEAGEFDRNWAAGTLPSYSFFTPNNDHNGHDTNVATASAWLRKFLEPKLADAARMNSTLFFVTFDESDSIFSNHVYAVALGPMVKTGHVSRREYDHYAHLRMVEENFGLGNLDVGDDFAQPMEQIFKR